MNRTALSAVMVTLLTLVLTTGAHAYAGSTQSLNASLLYYEPIPAEPGSVIDVFVQVENTGGSSQSVSVAFSDTFPFSIDTETDRIKTTPRIPSQESFLVKYRVRVSPDAEPGTNYIKVQYYTDPETVQSALLPIDVFSSDVSLAVDDVAVDPATISPGETGTITVRVRNEARLAITDGYVKLDLSSVDIIPYGTTDQQRLTGFSGGAERTFVFTIIPSPDLEPGAYQVPLVLNFTDQRGTRRSISQTIGLRVGAVPDVAVSLDDVSAGAKNGDADLIVRVTNKGLGEIKFATVTLGAADGYRVRSGGAERYVGNIDSDDYKTARVPVEFEDDEASIPVTLTYADAFNQPYTRQLTLVAQRPAKGNGSIVWVVTIVVIALAIGAWYLRRRKTRR